MPELISSSVYHPSSTEQKHSSYTTRLSRQCIENPHAFILYFNKYLQIKLLSKSCEQRNPYKKMCKI